MAAWLKGRCSYQPRYGGEQPDGETYGLIPVLAEINNHGFVTTCSQPGISIEAANAPSSRACAQRTPPGRSGNVLHGTELVVVAFPPITLVGGAR
jgi:hypothetical protein